MTKRIPGQKKYINSSLTIWTEIVPVLIIGLLLVGSVRADPVSVGGERVQWRPVVVDVRGPEMAESDSAPNPFLDVRLRVDFTGPEGQTYEVHGFFAGNGRGSGTGRTWRVRFAPDQSGNWTYRVSFRRGPHLAIQPGTDGDPLPPDGWTGSFSVEEPTPNAPGFFRRGFLLYTGSHYLQFENGDYWIKGGTDSPENFLAYGGFDGTSGVEKAFDQQDHESQLHDYTPHERHWRTGDPDWGNGNGKRIIGALNYLSSRHVNSIYILTMNIGGDGQDVHPWIGSPEPGGSSDNDNLHYDVSKLKQWNTVLEHAQKKGIFLHLVLNEAEEANKRELDDGELGPERKLYYRELITRFSYLPALQWNICEEYNLKFDLGPERVNAFARYIQELDPYGHPITVHSAGDPREELAFTFGNGLYGITSVQLNQRPIDRITEDIRRATEEAGRPLPASMDEFTIDTGQNRSWVPVDDAEKHRKRKIWPAYLSGGQLEFILEGLLNVNRFNTPEREQLWQDLWHARSFLLEHLPFQDMEPADELLSYESLHHTRGQVFAKTGTVYAVYLPNAARNASLDLSAEPSETGFELRWYNPRNGKLSSGSQTVPGGAEYKIGDPPSSPTQDWVVLLKKIN